MAKNFDRIDTGKRETGVNTGEVYAAIERGKDEFQRQGMASLEEQEERKKNLRTQGRKGCKLQRINVAFSPDNMDYIHILSKATGMSMTKVINKIIEQHQRDHMSEFDRAQELAEDLFSIGEGLDN